MKTKLVLLLGLGFIIAGAGIYLTGDVDYTTPGTGHFVSPLRSDLAWGPAKQIRAFFPSQANLQWLSGAGGYTQPNGGAGSMATHPGSSSVVSGTTSCTTCHGASLTAGTFGANLVSTAAGIPNKEAYKDITVQSAYDNEYFYVKAEWTTQRQRPGVTHNVFTYLNGSWQAKSKNKVPGKSQIADLGADEFYSYEDRFAVMLVPKSVGDSIKAFGSTGVSFNQAGCFVACHSSMRYMPHAPASTAVSADPWLGTTALKVTDLRHYLLHTRGVSAFADADSIGNWQTTASNYNAAKQSADFNNQKFIDLWQARGARSGPLYCGSNDAVMEYRHSGLAETNKGANNWFDQNLATAQPSNVDSLAYDTLDHKWKVNGTAVTISTYDWMYDSSITGFYFLPANAVDAASGELKIEWTVKYPLITQGPDRNAIPYDSTKVTTGVLVPKQVLIQSTGIRGMLNVYSKWESATKKWTAIFRRKLNTTKCDHGSFGTYCSDLNITKNDLIGSGQGLTIAFAVFDDHSTARFHHISFPFTMQDKTGADIVMQYNYPVAVNEQALPGNYMLQNYPNPFNAFTDIRFNLPAKSNVHLEIRDVTGRLVSVLVNKAMNAGEHTVTWNVADVAKGGVYFYTLQTDDFVQTKRMLVVK